MAQEAGVWRWVQFKLSGGRRGAFQYALDSLWNVQAIDSVKVLVLVTGQGSFSISTAIVDNRSITGGDLN